jgi:hypothetical protein
MKINFFKHFLKIVVLACLLCVYLVLLPSLVLSRVFSSFSFCRVVVRFGLERSVWSYLVWSGLAQSGRSYLSSFVHCLLFEMLLLHHIQTRSQIQDIYISSYEVLVLHEGTSKFQSYLVYMSRVCFIFTLWY